MNIRKALVAAALSAAMVPVAQAVPVLGSNIYVAETGNVTTTFLFNGAGYSNNLFLYLPSNGFGVIFNNQTTAPGTTYDLGTFTAGTELQFAIYVLDTGHTFFSGDASRNADGLAHAVVDTEYYTGETYVGFEDLWGGGDRDYDDVAFSFSNVATTPSVPEPASLALLGAGLLGLGAARRKRD